MAITAISVDEAFAQGSSWSQMLSVAHFHREQIGLKQKSKKPAPDRALDWKARQSQKVLEVAVREHHEYATHFEALASRMKAISEEISANGD